MKLVVVFIFSLLVLTGGLPVNFVLAADHLGVVISEVAWMGTENSYADEWIELCNDTDSLVNLDGWILKAVDGSPKINLTGNVPVGSFYLLERSKDYTGALENGGEILELYDNLGNLIDKIDASSGWPAGDNTTKQTMERKDAASWQTSVESGGTPKTRNSEPTDDNPPPKEVPLEVVPPPAEVTPQTNKESYEVVPRKNIYTWWAAGLIAFFSGGAVLILKKKYNK